jgi:hypothetical protein
MRTIFLTTLVVLFSSFSFAWTKIEKYNGGFFGYKTVTEDHAGGNNMLACHDPGRKSCQFASISTSGDDGITLSQLDEIDRLVNTNVSNENFEGTFYYNSTFYVHFSYDLDKNKLNYEIYNLTEAHDLGFI